MKKEKLILTPPPFTYYHQNENERELEQREFPFMDETPPTKLFKFMEKKENDLTA
jgi:hypothetical protein